jgi:hypothetical protein
MHFRQVFVIIICCMFDCFNVDAAAVCLNSGISCYPTDCSPLFQQYVGENYYPPQGVVPGALCYKGLIINASDPVCEKVDVTTGGVVSTTGVVTSGGGGPTTGGTSKYCCYVLSVMCFCCALSVVRYLLCVICCALSVVRYLLCVICCVLSVMRYLLCVICYLLSVICYLLSVICYLLCVICYVMRYLLSVMCYVLRVMYHLYSRCITLFIPSLQMKEIQYYLTPFPAMISILYFHMLTVLLIEETQASILTHTFYTHPHPLT